MNIHQIPRVNQICPECGELLSISKAGDSLQECPECAAVVTPLGTTSIPLVEPDGDDFRAGPTVELPAGIIERFRIGRLLGAGGMATVYHAQDRRTNEEVAIKVLSRPYDPAHRARFEREGRLLMKLNHPNVVRLVDLENLEALPCLVMEYVDGGTLRRRLATARMAIPAAISIALDILAGLETLHLNGIVHRDLKPENVLITSTGQSKLSDLGIAKPFDRTTELTATGHLVGTPRYMSPEQLLGGAVTETSDLYTFGLLFYELLAGHPPTPPGLIDLVKFHHSNTRFKFPKDFAADVPDALLRLIEDTLVPEPDERPPSARELARRIHLALSPVHRDARQRKVAELSDEELMCAAARGDTAAFSELVQRHTQLAWRIAFSFLSDAVEAEDVAQQSFLKIHLRAAAYRPTASFRAYLRCVVTRLCLDRAAKKVAEPIDRMPAMIDPLPTPGEQMVRKERTGAVRAAISSLPPLQRAACILRYFDDCGHAQIGEALGITPKAAEHLLARARERLAAYLGDDF